MGSYWITYDGGLHVRQFIKMLRNFGGAFRPAFSCTRANARVLPIGWRSNNEQSAVQQSNVALARNPPKSAYPFGRPLPREAMGLDRLTARSAPRPHLPPQSVV